MPEIKSNKSLKSDFLCLSCCLLLVHGCQEAALRLPLCAQNLLSDLSCLHRLCNRCTCWCDPDPQLPQLQPGRPLCGNGRQLAQHSRCCPAWQLQWHTQSCAHVAFQPPVQPCIEGEPNSKGLHVGSFLKWTSGLPLVLQLAWEQLLQRAVQARAACVGDTIGH